MSFVMAQKSFLVHRKDFYNYLDFKFKWFAKLSLAEWCLRGSARQNYLGFFSGLAVLPFLQLLIQQAPGWYLYFEKVQMIPVLFLLRSSLWFLFLKIAQVINNEYILVRNTAGYREPSGKAAFTPTPQAHHTPQKYPQFKPLSGWLSMNLLILHVWTCI